MRRTALALAVALVALAGCQSHGQRTESDVLPPFPSETATARTTTTATATGSPGATEPVTDSGSSGGGATPEEAVTRLLQAFAKNDPQAVCALVVPDQRSDCRTSFAAFIRSTSAADFALGKVTTEGDAALVTVTSRAGICLDAQCQVNADPTAGQPAAGVPFAQALDRVRNGRNVPVFIARRVDGRWYCLVS